MSTVQDFELVITNKQRQQFRSLFDELLLVTEDGGATTNNTKDADSCGQWDFFNSLFFSFTAVTTIGYGRQFPETNNGRLACIFYSLVGVPLNAILIGALGGLFKDKVMGLKQRLVVSAGTNDAGIGSSCASLGRITKVVLEAVVWMAIFTSVFLFLPAAFFAYSGLEPDTWDYTDSVYFTFITLSTIGFGDLVPGQNPDSVISYEWRVVYLTAVIVWIIFGLGYIIGVINLLVATMEYTGKPVKRVFKALRNQEYWKKVIHEIAKLKRQDNDDGNGQSLYSEEVVDGDMTTPKVDFDQKFLSADMADLDQRTVTSIRNFLDAINNADGGAIGNSSSKVPGSQQFLSVPGATENRRQRKPSKVSMRNFDGDNSISQAGSAIGDLLEQTTLGEFLAAVDNVEEAIAAAAGGKDDTNEKEAGEKSPTSSVGKPGRKISSMFRKISAMGQPPSQQQQQQYQQQQQHQNEGRYQTQLDDI